MVPALELAGGVVAQVFGTVVQLAVALLVLSLLSASLGGQKKVGKPLTSDPGGTSLAVVSIFTMTTSFCEQIAAGHLLLRLG